MKKSNKLKGSAILVVLFSSIAFYIYVMSVNSEAEHFSIIQKKYEKNITEKYNIDIDEYYNNTKEKNQMLNNF